MAEPPPPGPTPGLTPGACPICGAKPDPKLRPFCSAHCADVDLGRWFTGQYRLPTRPDEEEAGEGA